MPVPAELLAAVLASELGHTVVVAWTTDVSVASATGLTTTGVPQKLDVEVVVSTDVLVQLQALSKYVVVMILVCGVGME